jgi:hypothetical protein
MGSAKFEIKQLDRVETAHQAVEWLLSQLLAEIPFRGPGFPEDDETQQCRNPFLTALTRHIKVWQTGLGWPFWRGGLSSLAVWRLGKDSGTKKPGSVPGLQHGCTLNVKFDRPLGTPSQRRRRAHGHDSQPQALLPGATLP